MKLLSLLLLGAISPLLLLAAAAAPAPTLLSIPVETIDGQPGSLESYQGKVLLIVNTASQCGFTPQYEGLEALWQKYQAKGLTVVGFPSNDFGAQEPGSNAEIKAFCMARFHVTFPMYAKIHVKGAEQHPLYKELTGGAPKPGPVGWNFNKFLIGRDGRILAHFDSETEPDSAALAKAIEAALEAK